MLTSAVTAMSRAIRLLAFLSILCCVIAGYVSLRMRRLKSAISRFGSGKLEVRLPSDDQDPLRHLSETFNTMAERMESLVDAHRRLCIDISHELRSPLARLSVALGLAWQRTGPDAHTVLERIELETNRLNELVVGLENAMIDAACFSKPAMNDRPTFDSWNSPAGS